MKKKAMITGVTGQDGSYLSELLLKKEYEVHGIIRRTSDESRERIEHLEGRDGFILHDGDLTDAISIVRLVADIRPAEVDFLLGDPSKAKSELGWNPEKTPFDEVVRRVVVHDLNQIKKDGFEGTG